MLKKVIISLLYYTNSVFEMLLQIFLLFNFPSVLRNLITVAKDLMLPNNSLSSIINSVKGIQSSKMRLKLLQYFKDKRGST